MQVIPYLRVSSNPDGESKSVPQQREAITAWAESKGYTLGAEFVDDGRSASRYARGQRPEFKRLLAWLDDNPEATVVAWDLDRLLRNPRELEDLIDRAEKGLRVVTLGSGKVDLSRPMVARMLTAVAADESDRISKRVKRAKESNARQGLPARVAKVRAFGWLDGMTPDPNTAPLIVEAVDDLLAGASLSSIARRWNELGVARPRGGSLWSSTTVKNVVTSPRNAGLVQYQGEALDGVEASWPAIVDRAKWQQLRSMLAANVTKHKPRRVGEFTGILRCGRCGEVLYRDRQKSGNVVYRCKPAPHKPSCGRLAVGGEIETVVREMLFAAVEGGSLARRAPVGPVDSSELQAVEERMTTLAELFAAGDIGRSEWLAARDRLDQKRRELSAAMVTPGPVVSPWKGQPDELRDAWDGLDAATRNAILRAVFVGVTVAPADGGTVLDRVRDGVEWRA